MPTYATTNLTEAADYKKVTTAGGFRVNGLGGNDIITMSPPTSSTTPDTPDYLDGGNANDTLTAAQTDDVLVGGAGDDILKAGDGKDFLYGDEGGDLDGDGLPDVTDKPRRRNVRRRQGHPGRRQWRRHDVWRRR